eukprot:Awhi_evm1s4080
MLGNDVFIFKYDAVIIAHNSVPIVTNLQATNMNEGCGGHDQKCKCQETAVSIKDRSTTVHMQGQGTSGTGTSLDFQCEFDLTFANKESCHCVMHWDSPLVGADSWSVS